jgi:hypothetical protein
MIQVLEPGDRRTQRRERERERERERRRTARRGLVGALCRLLLALLAVADRKRRLMTVLVCFFACGSACVIFLR